jgi:hypothetical protein
VVVVLALLLWEFKSEKGKNGEGSDTGRGQIRGGVKYGEGSERAGSKRAGIRNG